MKVVAYRRVVVGSYNDNVARYRNPKVSADVENHGRDVVVRGENAARFRKRLDKRLEAGDEIAFVPERPWILESVARMPHVGENCLEPVFAPAAPPDAPAPSDEGEVGAIRSRQFALCEIRYRRIVVFDREDAAVPECLVVWVDVDDWNVRKRSARRQEV